MARLALLEPDLLLGSRLVATLEAAGHEVELCSEDEEAWAAAERCDALLVDLGNDEVDGIALVDSMRAGGELRGKPALGFYPHVEEETRRRAQGAGFDVVVPRSRMARDAHQLVDSLLAGR